MAKKKETPKAFNKMYANDPQAKRYQQPRRAGVIFNSKVTGQKVADIYTGKDVKAKAKNLAPIQKSNESTPYSDKQLHIEAERQLKLYKNKEGYPTFAAHNKEEA
tara:strand:- start:258 stop:572 length:315 start_codon:yes stop_codon:yes gene_type:complete